MTVAGSTVGHDGRTTGNGADDPPHGAGRSAGGRAGRLLEGQDAAAGPRRAGGHDPEPDPGGAHDAAGEGRHPAAVAADRRAAQGQGRREARRGRGEGPRQPPGAPAARDQRRRHRVRAARGLPGRRRPQLHAAHAGVPHDDARHGGTGPVPATGGRPAAEPDGRHRRQHRCGEVDDQVRQEAPEAPRGDAVLPRHEGHRGVRDRPVARLPVPGADLLRPRHHLPPEGAGQADQALPRRATPRSTSPSPRRRAR